MKYTSLSNTHSQEPAISRTTVPASNIIGPKLDPQILGYYQEFMDNVESYLPDTYRQKIPTGHPVPFHVYLLAQKIAIMKKILLKVGIDYYGIYIMKDDYQNLCLLIDEFYKDKNALQGEMIAMVVVILECYYDLTANISHTSYAKFQTRVIKYRKLFKEELTSIIIEKLGILAVGCDLARTEDRTGENALLREIYDRIQNLTLIEERNTPAEAITSLLENVINKKKRPMEKHKLLATRYAFVKEALGIPEKMFKTTIEIVVWYGIKGDVNFLQKKIKSVTILKILASWQLLANEQGLFVPEEHIEKLYSYYDLKRGNKETITSSKTLEKMQNDILKKLYLEKMGHTY